MPSPEVIRLMADVPGVSIVVTTRVGGVSTGPYSSFNLATHVNDDPAQVEENRARLVSHLALEHPPVWLDQVHGVKILDVDSGESERAADGSITSVVNRPLAIMTADCVPIILTHPSRPLICALHAGWRGLASGIIGLGAARFGSGFSAMIGPCIGPCHYEVDDRVRQAFTHADAFASGRPGHYQFDLVAEARRQLIEAGAGRIESVDICTACDERFYSFRRDGETGRFAMLAWLRGDS